MYLTQPNLLSLLQHGPLVLYDTFIILSMNCTYDCIYIFNVLLMMGAESTRNLYSNLAVNNKYDCLKLHHVGNLIK
jgi:hypothetical protein